MDIETLLIAMSIPSAVTGFCFWLIEHRINQREREEEKKREQHQKDMDQKERLREESQFLILQSVNAAIALGEATAKAVQRIPDANCNGDMHAALDYATKVKHEQKEFLTKQGIQNILDE
mgnify:CR=1 FL=1